MLVGCFIHSFFSFVIFRSFLAKPSRFVGFQFRLRCMYRFYLPASSFTQINVKCVNVFFVATLVAFSPPPPRPIFPACQVSNDVKIKHILPSRIWDRTIRINNDTNANSSRSNSNSFKHIDVPSFLYVKVVFFMHIPFYLFPFHVLSWNEKVSCWNVSIWYST